MLECALATAKFLTLSEQENVKIWDWRVLPGHSGDIPGDILCHQKLDTAKEVLIILSYFLPFILTGVSVCITLLLSNLISFSPSSSISVTLKWYHARVRKKSGSTEDLIYLQIKTSPLGPNLETMNVQMSPMNFKKTKWKFKYKCLLNVLCFQKRRWLWTKAIPSTPLEARSIVLSHCALNPTDKLRIDVAKGPLYIARKKSLCKETKSTPYIHAWDTVGVGKRK